MPSNSIKVAIGVDYREMVAYHTAVNSILKRSSAPLQFIPIALNNLQDVYKREHSATASTEFSFSRFLSPYLCDYEGWVLFMDCDIVLLDDIAKLWALRDDRYAIQCVQHDHQPKNTTKFLGQIQTVYEKKNWSSLMLMNCRRCTALTPDYVNSATGLDLHRFNWLESDDLIGALPPEWNHLVTYSPGKLEDQKALHWTEGGPYFPDYADTKWASVWQDEFKAMSSVVEKKLQAK